MTGHITRAIQDLGTEITKLEKDLTDNRKLAGIITLQIKAIFAKERAKFEIPPEPLPQMLQLNAPQMKTRSVNVNTSNTGSGNQYEQPTKPDYNNPIEIVHYLHGQANFMRFATRDGDIGNQPPSHYSLGCIATQPANTEVAKIQVWYSDRLYGIRFMTKENTCILSAGYVNNANLQEISL